MNTSQVDVRRIGSPILGALIVAFAFWLVMGATTIPTPLYPKYALAFTLDPAEITVVFAAYPIGVVCGMIALGRISDSWGRKTVIWLALALSFLSDILFVEAGDLTVLLVARVLTGLAAALVTGAATAAILELFPKRSSSGASLLSLFANMGGLACGPLLAGLAAEWIRSPLRTPWVVHACVAIVGALMLVLVPETVSAPEIRVRTMMTRGRIPTEIKAMFLYCALLGGVGFALQGVLTVITGNLLNTRSNVHGPAVTGAIVFIGFLFIAIGQLTQRRASTVRSLARSCAMLLAAMALMATASLAGSAVLLGLSAVFIGLGSGSVIHAGLVVIAKGVQPVRRGGVVSKFFTILFVMLGLPAIGVGVLIEIYGITVAIVVFSVVSAAFVVTVAGVIYFRMGFHRRGSSSGARTVARVARD